MERLLAILIAQFTILSISYGQNVSKVAVICRQGQAEYYINKIGWKSFVATELPVSGKIRMQKGAELQVMELIPSKANSSKYEPDRWYSRRWQSLKDSVISGQDLANSFQQTNNNIGSFSGLLKQIFSDLFSKDPPTKELGSSGGISRGINCPIVKMVSPEMESLFKSNKVHFFWRPSEEPVKSYFLKFYNDNRISSNIWNPLEVENNSIQIELPTEIFKPGEIYYWSVGNKLNSVCELQAFRILTPDEKNKLDSAWDNFSKVYSYPESLMQIIKAEYYIDNGLFYEANIIYSRLNTKTDVLDPIIIQMRLRSLARIGI